MATTNYGVNANETVKLWGRKLFRESLAQTFLSRFIGDDSNAIIQSKDDMTKGPGDRLRNTLRVQLSGDGISGDSTLEGSEEALTTYTDDFVVDQLRHAVRSGGRMTEQRIPFSVREEARLGLTDWWADRIDTALFNQLCGNNAQSDTKFTGSNSVTAPDNTHHFWPGVISADESLTAAETMSIDLIDNIVMEAKTQTPILRPVMVGGDPHYTMFLHPGQVKDLRTSTTTGQWLDIQKAAMSGGKISDNPIFTGALGVYNGVVLHEATRVTLGVNSSTSVAVANTRRAVLMGSQAGVVGFGRNNGGATMTWVEELFDLTGRFSQNLFRSLTPRGVLQTV